MEHIIAKLEDKGHFKLARELSKAREERVESKKPWGSLPKGWTEKSLEKFARSLTKKTKGSSKGFVRACIKKLEGTGISSPEAFCSSLKDRYLGKKTWRKGRGK